LATFDVDQFKQQFPVFAAPENRHLVYLDNAATTQRPHCVIEAVSDFYIHNNANAHRSSHRLARSATSLLESVRRRLAVFLNSTEDSCVFTSGATAAMNMAVFAVCEYLQEGDEIILSVAEHHANIVPWQRQAELRGLVLRFLPVKLGCVDVAALNALMNERTRVVCLSAASNVLGTTLDVTAVKQYVCDRDVLFGLDLAQYVAHQSVDMQQLGCDFAVFSAHKMYGPTGVGVMWAKPELLAKWSPLMSGGEMIEHVDVSGSSFRQGYAKFETGTANLAGLAGFAAVLNWWAGIDRQGLAAHERELTGYAIEQLSRVNKLHIVSAKNNNIGVVSFAPSADCAFAVGDIVNWLDEADIAVRAGVMCAEPLAKALGHSALIRLSIAGYNTRADIDNVVKALEELFCRDVETTIGDIDDLLNAASWQARYRIIMQWGSDLAVQHDLRTQSNLVKGCETDVWMEVSLDDGRVNLKLDADSRVMRGLCDILLRLINGRDVTQISEAGVLQALQALQLQKHLTDSRANGFATILKTIFMSLKAG